MNCLRLETEVSIKTKEALAETHWAKANRNLLFLKFGLSRAISCPNLRLKPEAIHKKTRKEA